MLLLLRDRVAVLRVLGFVVLASAVAYLFTPLTASGLEGKPIGFASNLRYLGARARARPRAASPSRSGTAPKPPRRPSRLLVIALSRSRSPATRCATASARARADGRRRGRGRLRWRRRCARSGRVPRLGRARPRVAIAAVRDRRGRAIACSANYLDDRYASDCGIGEPGLDVGLHRGPATSRDARIATITIRQYPLYGGDLSNHVQYVGERGSDDSFTPITSCDAWRRAINAGDYDYVVTASNIPSPDAKRPPEAAWTGDDPAAKQIVHDGPISVFRLDGELDPADC